MKTLLPLFCGLFLCTLLQGKMDKNQFELSRGVNISHWLSQRGDRPREQMQTYFTEFDVIMLSQAGFDHLRIPIDEVEFWDDNGKPREDAWAFLEKGLDWTRRHGLRAIVDLHIVRSHYFNVGNEEGDTSANTLFEDRAEQEKFVDLWREISDRLGHHSVDWVAYEFLNEAVGDDPEDWNNLVRMVYGAMREKEPRRTFVIGSYQWQVLDTLKHLWVPENDPNLIISFHNYEPFLITHHKAEWTPLREYQGPVNYPGVPVKAEDIPDNLSDRARQSLIGANKPFDFNYALERLQIAKDFSEKHNLPLYCGEWGCIIYAPREIRLAYYRDWINAFEAMDIAQTIWDYKGHFRIVNDDTKEIDHELIDILIGK